MSQGSVRGVTGGGDVRYENLPSSEGYFAFTGVAPTRRKPRLVEGLTLGMLTGSDATSGRKCATRLPLVGCGSVDLHSTPEGAVEKPGYGIAKPPPPAKSAPAGGPGVMP